MAGRARARGGRVRGFDDPAGLPDRTRVARPERPREGRGPWMARVHPSLSAHAPDFPGDLISSAPPERWPSGRRRLIGSQVTSQGVRGFESHSLRHLITMMNGAYGPVFRFGTAGLEARSAPRAPREGRGPGMVRVSPELSAATFNTCSGTPIRRPYGRRYSVSGSVPARSDGSDALTADRHNRLASRVARARSVRELVGAISMVSSTGGIVIIKRHEAGELTGLPLPGRSLNGRGRAPALSEASPANDAGSIGPPL